jgi:cellulose synthase operon protein C
MMWTSRRFAIPALAALFLAALPAVAGAQQDNQSRAMRPGVTVDLTVQRSDPAASLDAGDAVDTTLLRAYASRFDYPRVDEEIRRLKEMHPGWTPPTDLFAPKAAAVDERGLWTSWERGDLVAVDREIAILGSLNPGWTPPAKLTELVAARRTREAVAAAATGGNWDGIVRLAAGKPNLFTCDQIENLWDLAQAQFRTGDRPAAYATYGAAMTTCKSADLRLATLQKALANRDNAELKALIEAEAGRSRTVEEEGRFASIQKDFGGNGNATGKGAAQTATAAPDKLGEALGRLVKGRADATEVSWIEGTARDQRDARAAEGLGWYYFNAKKWNEAGTWFKSSMDWKPSAKAAEGLVYAWQKLGRDNEARALAANWAGKAPKLKEILKSGGGSSRLTAAFESGDFATVLSLTEPGRGPEAASGQTLRGWALLKLTRPAEAARAFEAALKRAGSDKAKAADAAQGLALANNAQGLSREARAVIEANAVAPEKSAKLEAGIMTQDALAAFNRGSFNEALRLIAQVKRLAPEDQSLAMIEAWSLYKINRFAEAQSAFQRLTEVYGSAEARDGLRLATAQVNRRWE